jgi:hypothetical protein
MRVFSDVSPETGPADDELSVVSETPGVVDEVMSLGLTSREGQMHLQVRVLDSRPLIINGVVRHRLRLRVLGPQ